MVHDPDADGYTIQCLKYQSIITNHFRYDIESVMHVLLYTPLMHEMCILFCYVFVTRDGLI